MENVTYKAVFHTEGFETGKDVSEEEINLLRGLFVQMYDAFSTGINQNLEKINDIWHKYEDLKRKGDRFAIALCRQAMEIDSEMDYTGWLEKWYKETANVVDLAYAWSPLQSRIFRDGENLIYGVCFAERPDWTMHLTIEQD